MSLASPWATVLLAAARPVSEVWWQHPWAAGISWTSTEAGGAMQQDRHAL